MGRLKVPATKTKGWSETEVQNKNRSFNKKSEPAFYRSLLLNMNPNQIKHVWIPTRNLQDINKSWRFELVFCFS